MPWSILLGVLAVGDALHVPGPIERTVAMLAGRPRRWPSFTIGAVLARSALLARGTAPVPAVAAGPGQRGRPLAAAGPGGAGGRAAVVAIKLLAHPLLVWALARGERALGSAASSEPALVAMVLAAALPSASNVSMLAERFGADNGRIARIILWTTVAAFFSFPLAAGWWSGRERAELVGIGVGQQLAAREVAPLRTVAVKVLRTRPNSVGEEVNSTPWLGCRRSLAPCSGALVGGRRIRRAVGGGPAGRGS